ncbi:Lysine methyltransferase protein [Dioscorea alata]|uniref:Lysine methyltransferase protein n=1 Tax=Dioscorea alata TaxID=55571 RepID=A0ACB7WTR8_DIOAL|nr:Lysine methyltransferase protein [Dioscorea alata]
MEDERLNSPSTSTVVVEVLGHRLHISQDPNSKHLGTTVWDASMVFVKFLEKNSRKGRFCPSKLKGKRAIELGAGCGLAGLGMALLGCDVVSTDQVEVLPLLMRNVQRNMSWIMQANPSESVGAVEVVELDWGNKDHIRSVCPPFDYIIATDVVYAEHLLDPLVETILALAGPRTTILIGYEIRSNTVHEQMTNMWKNNFEVKTIPKAKMDLKYRHPSIQLFMMELKVQSKPEDSTSDLPKIPETGCGTDEAGDNYELEEKEESKNEESVAREDEKVDDWETRRAGAMAARLLRDVKIA